MIAYRSQHGEDRWIHQNLKLPDVGTFVEVGASDGITYSNSKFFEDIGWDGLCIEPHPKDYAQLAKRRRCRSLCCAITSGPGQQFYFDAGESTWSGFLSQPHRRTPAEIPQHTLNEVLCDHGIRSIDLLSIDTEGTELDVWKSFDHEAWKPRIVIIEWMTQEVINTAAQILDVFGKLPYRCVHLTPSNFIFERL